LNRAAVRAKTNKEDVAMQKRLLMALLSMTLVVSLAIPLATWAGPQGGGAGQAGGGQAGGAAKAGKAGRERHPAIRHAIVQLEAVKKNLETEAARDFEGHRAKAVEHIEQALAELRLALKADVK
jgi:hypothetical protein